MKLQHYDFSIDHCARKTNANADALSRMYDQEVTCYMVSFQEESDEYLGNSEDDPQEESAGSQMIIGSDRDQQL